MTERLLAELNKVAPISVVHLSDGDSPSVTIQFRDDATAAQKDAAYRVLAAFDWSEAAQRTWEEARQREQAKGLTLGLAADSLARRAGDWVTFQLLVQVVTAFNALRERVPAPPSLLPPALPVPTWGQFLQDVQKRIDAETRPGA
jgi:hypothetical protein